MEQSGSAGTASGGQMQQAGPSEEAAGERCPICLGTTRNTTYVSTCFHTFSFRCIRQRAATRSTCPLWQRPPNPSTNSQAEGPQGLPLLLPAQPWPCWLPPAAPTPKFHLAQ
uniref:RING-type E3 ubiquitin transferase n=1 Tax=Anser brachyrhynchus TaxID=132585 RepID=A0A8B9BBX3_9AVES